MSPDQQIATMMVPLTALLLSAGMGLHWVIGDHSSTGVRAWTNGVGHWAGGHLLFSLGLVIIAFRETLPLPVGTVSAAGCLCTVGGLLTVRIGLRRFLGQASLPHGWWWLLAAGLIFNIALAPTIPTHLRIAFNTAMIAIASGGLCWEFLRSPLPGLHRWIGCGLCLFATLFLALRAIGIATSPETTNPLDGGFHIVWAFVALIVWTRPMHR